MYVPVTFWGWLRITFAYVAAIVDQAKEEVKKLISKAQANELEAQPGRTIMESFENQVPSTHAQHHKLIFVSY